MTASEAFQPLRLAAQAKVNLTLRIVARRPDGFHELETLFCSVSLADELRVAPAAEPGLRLAIAGPEAGPLAGESGAENLAVRAWRSAEAALRASDRLPPDWPGGVDLRLEKRIPVGAGLAGGSADAAAALRAANAWAGGALPHDRLRDLAAGLGSDVPFCLEGGCALGRGRGEILEPLPVPEGLRMLLVKPPFAISTRDAYAACRPAGPWPPGHAARLRTALSAPRPLSSLAPLLENTFYGPSLPHFDELRRLEAEISAAGAGAVVLSGSGPTLIGFFPNDKSLETAKKRLHKKSFCCWSVQPVCHGIEFLPR